MTDKLRTSHHRLLGGLTGRILLSFILVSVVAVCLVALFSNQITTHQFELYVSSGRQMRANRLSPYFAAYYSETGSWNGVEALMDALSESVSTGGRGMGMGRGNQANAIPMMTPGDADRLILTNTRGQVLVDSNRELQGELLSSETLGSGSAVLVNGKAVANLILAPVGTTHDSAQNEFLRQVNKTLIWAGLGSALIAILLGFFLARRLTAPLRMLTEAAERVAEGELKQQVAVQGADEIADLGRSFNRMIDSLAQQEQLRQNLMAEIAHELRTPLTVMRSDLEALLDGVYDATPETIASLHEETLLLTRLVEDLRALSLAEAGQLRLQTQKISIRDVLAAEAGAFAPLAENKDVELVWEMPPDPLEVEADAQRLKQVVANLLSNALHHTPSGGRIALRARGDTDTIEVLVTDSGSGIIPHDLPHVFDRFWQSDTARPGEGSGLGLAIVKGLVEAHGGRVWAESRPSQGAEFHFMLPRTVASAKK